LEAVIFSNVWGKHGDQLGKDKLAVLLVELQKGEEELKLIIHDIALAAEDRYEQLLPIAKGMLMSAKRRNEGVNRAKAMEARQLATSSSAAAQGGAVQPDAITSNTKPQVSK